MSFKRYRKTRGDGNCFFRSFAFCFFERLCSSDKFASAFEKLKTDWNGLMASVGYDKIAYEDFLEEYFTLLSEFHAHIPILKAADIDPSDWLAENWRNNPLHSNTLIIVLRMLVSAHLQLNSEEYLPFIYELSDPSLASKGPKAIMEDYCRRHVEAIGVESDQIDIIAMTRIMPCQLEIVYLTASHSLDNMVMTFGEQSDSSVVDGISLLYRPGHYDILYRH